MKIMGIFLTAFGFFGFVGGFFISSGIIDYDGELPLGHVTSIVVDNRGDIYIGLGFYSKVQVYDSKGNFLRNWQVEAGGGTFAMDLTPEQNILVSVARGRNQILYNQYGIILSRNKIKGDTTETHQFDVTSYKTQEGILYDIKGWVIPKVTRLLPPKQVVIKQNVFLQLIRGPFPAWMWLGIGTALRFLNQRREEQSQN